MTTFVLVHGAAHGGWCYQPVARLLEAQGHTVYRPTLSGLGDRSHLMNADIDLETHITDIANLLFYENLEDVVLVGHSYGGFAIAGAADRQPGRVAKLVYLDAPPVDTPPKHGQMVVDGYPPLRQIREFGQVIDGVELVLFLRDDPIAFDAGTGVTDPEAIEWMKPRLTPHPWKSIDQPLVLNDPAGLDAIPRYQIVTTGTMPARDPEVVAAARADGRFWEIDNGHDLMITEPELLARLLGEIASRDERVDEPR